MEHGQMKQMLLGQAWWRRRKDESDYGVSSAMNKGTPLGLADGT